MSSHGHGAGHGAHSAHVCAGSVPAAHAHCGCHGGGHEEAAARQAVWRRPSWLRAVDVRVLVRAGLGAILLAVVLLAGLPPFWAMVVALVAYVVVGLDVLVEAAERIIGGDVFNEFFLMSVATIGAIALGDFSEAVAVMLFYLVGEFFQDLAGSKSRNAISALLDIRPDTARLVVDDGYDVVDPALVAVGQRIEVRPGERVPLDGFVLGGSADVDTSALTGESAPRAAAAGDKVLAGFVVANGVLELEVTETLESSAMMRIMNLVREAEARKASTERLITRFARVYTPLVVLLAVLLAALGPLLTGAPAAAWIRRALVFLVISCPCALVVSIPLSYFAGIGVSARRGILVKGGQALEALAHVRTAVFDKTGTITTGRLSVERVDVFEPFSRDDVLAFAKAAEAASSHPAAKAILAYREASVLPKTDVSLLREHPGLGISARVDGRLVLIGNTRLMERHGVDAGGASEAASAVYLAIDGRPAARFVFADDLKANARPALEALRSAGIRRTVLLSGDEEAVALHTAASLPIDDVVGNLLPEGKAAHLDRLKQAGERILFVGDGINDAPVIAAADVGMAMGSVGSDAAIEAADIVLMTDDLERIAEAIAISGRTNRNAVQNIVIALGGKAVFLVLGALGFVGMWGAVFADTGLALLAILNAVSLLMSGRSGRKKQRN